MGWVVIAFAFAAVWVYAFYREDIRNPEPLWLVGIAVFGGVLALYAANSIEARVTNLAAIEGTLAERARLSFLIAGPVEETLKFLAVAILISFNHRFDEPMDGIVYAAAAAAGFALAENLLFLHDQPSSILARGPGATGAHILFAGFWGGALGHAKQLTGLGRKLGVVAMGLLLGYLSHGLFDLTTWSVGKELSINAARGGQVCLLAGCAVFLQWRIKTALAEGVVLDKAHAVVGESSVGATRR